MDNRKVAANDVVGPCVFRNRPDKPIVIAAMLTRTERIGRACE